MKTIDKYLNRITMYRLLLYYLLVLVFLTSIFGFLDIIPYRGIDILASGAIAAIVCYISNFVFAKLLKATTNIESVFITALIVVLIFPAALPITFLPLIAVCVIAMASKYVLAYHKKHFFNPAAVAVFIIALFYPDFAATWWIGTSIMAVPVIIGGLLLMRRIQRGHMISVFLITYFLLTGISAFATNPSLTSLMLVWQSSLFSSALFFFAFVMLTEPLTSPTTQRMRTIYAMIGGVLYATPVLRIAGIAFAPEMALLGGNIFSFFVNPKYRLSLPFIGKEQISPDTYLFKFQKTKGFKFIPGQYMEWTLSLFPSDSRGNRRYFSIASAPHEKELMIAVKFYPNGSSFKKELLQLSEGTRISASSLSGDFLLPKDNNTPLAFIAGGVGIAPFRSMLEDIIRNKKIVNIMILFANKKEEDILFPQTLRDAEKYGIKTVHILTDKTSASTSWKGQVGHVNATFIRDEIKDFDKRIFYISGPRLMVQNFEDILSKLGVKRKNIKVDFFPGYDETSI
jgi:ferredoxin-NADP reductase/Na+-translocating ferredoxin:NAD+ oxidoreductase RnfD subunit